jgi:GntR family transcriptional regulator
VIQKRKKTFVEDYVVGFVREANKLGLSDNEIIELIKQVKGRDAK